jgi:hypothetical protein
MRDLERVLTALKDEHKVCTGTIIIRNCSRENRFRDGSLSSRACTKTMAISPICPNWFFYVMWVTVDGDSFA